MIRLMFMVISIPQGTENYWKMRLKKELLKSQKLLGRTVFQDNPRKLNAGQRQLLALGRGLVRKDTAIILLDEPMTQLDLHQRWF